MPRVVVVVALIAVGALGLPTPSASAQHLEAASFESTIEGERQRGGVGSSTGPMVRSAVIVAASTAGFAYALSRRGGETDHLAIPVAAGVAASTVAGWALSDAPRARVLAGSIVSTVPSMALAVFAAGSLEEHASRTDIVTVSFSLPHGLLTSGFSKRRP